MQQYDGGERPGTRGPVKFTDEIIALAPLNGLGSLAREALL